MARPAWPLRYEQVAFIAAITVVLLMGIGWGLPSKERIGLLLAGGGPTPEQVRLLNSLQTLRAAGRIAPDSLPARRGYSLNPAAGVFRWYADSIPGPRLAFTEVERLYALRSYILSTSTLDEDYTMVAIGNMDPRRLDFDPKRYIYGGSYLYPVGFVLFAMRSAGLLHVTRDFAYYMSHPSQIARIYVVGRLLNLLALVGTLVLLALLGRALGSDPAGTVAMLAYGLSTLVLEHTLAMKPHVFAAFWATLAVYLLVRYTRLGTRRWLVLSSLAAGYAAGGSMTAAAVGLIYPIVLFGRGRGRRGVAECVGALAGMAIAYLAMNPYTLIHFEAYRSMVANAGSESVTGLGVFGLHKLRWFLHGAFVLSYTFPVVLLGLPFMVWSCVRGSGPLRRLALATVALLLAFGTTSPMVRLSMFVAPLFCLFAGFAVAEWIVVPLRTRRLVRAGLVALLFLPGAANTALTLRDFVSDRVWYEPTTRWVRSARIGSGSTIGVFFTPYPADLPAFPFLHSRLIDMNAAAAAADPPEYVLVGNYHGEGRRLWMDHPLRSRYRLLHDLGYRPSHDWLRRYKSYDEARTGGLVYQRIDDSPAGAAR